MQLFEQNYRINSLVVNNSGRLGLYALLNILQDCAWEHAHQIGHGYFETMSRNTFWVLTRQKLQMHRWPAWGEEIQVQTWVRNPSSGSVIRDFQFHNKSGECLGVATTGWLLLDAQTRRPLKSDISTAIDARFVADKKVDIEPVKINLEGEFISLAEFEVRNSDIDVNQHVNNTKYAQWVLDAIPFEWHKRFILHDYEVNFLAETHLGDHVVIEKSQLSADEEEFKTSLFRGVRKSDSKILFTVRTFSKDLEVTR